MTPELQTALSEWRDARQAIFDTPVDKQATPAQFARLAKAEDALMTFARAM